MFKEANSICQVETNPISAVEIVKLEVCLGGGGDYVFGAQVYLCISKLSDAVPLLCIS